MSLNDKSWLNYVMFWGLFMGLLETTAVSIQAHITPFFLPYYSLAAFFSRSAFPHRAFPLSCCLLE